MDIYSEFNRAYVQVDVTELQPSTSYQEGPGFRMILYAILQIFKGKGIHTVACIWQKVGMISEGHQDQGYCGF